MRVSGTVAFTPGCTSWECVQAQAVPVDFTLSVSDQAELDRRLLALSGGECQASPACDPCSFTNLEVDGVLEYNNCCFLYGIERNLAYESVIHYIDAKCLPMVATEPVAQLRLVRRGSCLAVGQALDVTLQRDATGQMSVSGSYVVAAGCPDGGSGACVSSAAVTPFVLDAADQTTLDQLLASLPVSDCLQQVTSVCDFCVSTTLYLDGRLERRECCGQQNAVGFESAHDAITGFIDARLAR